MQINIRSIKGILLLSFLVVLWFISSKYKIFSALSKQHDDLPIIYALTPTFYRPLQKAELTRLSQTLMLVPNIYWVIVEDADGPSDLVTGIRIQTGLYERSVQLFIKTPTDFKLKKKDPHWSKPRGVEQRNTALEWVRHRLSEDLSTGRKSIVYFMDDDNTYSIELFKEMSKIETGRVGVWPVGLVGGLMVEKPIVDLNGVVTGFNAAWKPERPFPIDMAGFAVSGDLLLKFPEAKFTYDVEGGYQETQFLRQLTTVKYLQPLANKCTKVFVWHTRTESVNLKQEEKLTKKGKASDQGMEV